MAIAKHIGRQVILDVNHGVRIHHDVNKQAAPPVEWNGNNISSWVGLFIIVIVNQSIYFVTHRHYSQNNVVIFIYQTTNRKCCPAVHVVRTEVLFEAFALYAGLVVSGLFADNFSHPLRSLLCYW